MQNPEIIDTAKANALKLLEEAEQKRAALRFERGLLEFANGREDILNNPEFTTKLGSFIYDNFTTGKLDKSEPLIDILFDLLDQRRHEKVIHTILDQLGRQCLDGYSIRLMQYLCAKYAYLLQEKNNKSLVSAELCEFLAKCAELFVRSSLWNDFGTLINLLWKIRSITFSDEDGTVAPFKHVFEKIGTKDVFEKILLQYKTGDDDQKNLARRALNYFGEETILFLLNRLVYSKTKEERFLLLELLTGFGEEVVRTVNKFMDESLPWYAVRNLIILIADIGNPNHFDMIEGYLIHPDDRVQQQVVACIIKLGGHDLYKRLIRALRIVNDQIKLKLVMQLSNYSDKDIAGGLVDIIEYKEDINIDIREDLIFRICITLRSYPYLNVTETLKKILDAPGDEIAASKKVKTAALETLKILEPKLRHIIKMEKADLEGMQLDFDPEKEKSASLDVDDFLIEINEIINDGDLEAASAIMYKKIIERARAKDFQIAEVLRDKLLEINPDSLQDVIQAAEIIEEEKTNPSTGLQVDIWDDLFEKLTDNEYKCLMDCFSSESYKEDEKIIDVGEVDSCLYFINSGTVRLSCTCGRQETFLKRLKPGDVIGLGPFFSASVWTIKLVAQQATQVHVVQRSEFVKKCRDVPQLEKKIFDYVEKRANIDELIKMSGRDRRDFARYSINIMFYNTLLDPYGSSEGRKTFQGEMLDISKGGLAFSIRLSKKESANLLLGRQIVSEIELKGKEILKCFGYIVGVRYKHQIMKEFSIHVRFYNQLEQNQVTEVLNLVI